MRFCSSLASRVRSVETTRFQPVCRTWTINYAGGSTKGNKYESVLVKALSDGAFLALGKANLRDLTHGFRMAADAVVKNLNCRARRISTFEEMAQFGTAGENGDREIGELIAGAFEKGWEINDLIIVLVLHNPLVLIHEMKILNLNVIKQAIMSCKAMGRPLFIVAEDVENEVLGHFASDFQCAHSRVFGKPDMREKKLRITNALHAAKAATEEGIVPGGGVALLYASKELDKLQTTNSGQKIGVQIVQNALKMPAYMIASGTGIDGSVIDKLLEQDNSELGYDPAGGKYIDMFKCGVVDPLKLVRSEFASAASMISSKFEEYNLVHGS